jgi:hypothetical protein
MASAFIVLSEWFAQIGVDFHAGGIRLPARLIALALIICAPFCAQAPAGAAPLTITLQDALQRAAQYGAQIQSAEIASRLAHEDAAQAKAASLPIVTGVNQFIYTEGNGTPSGVFVANDGVHVYNEQLQAHEELLSLVRRGEIRLAAAAEAVARAKADVAARNFSRLPGSKNKVVRLPTPM